MSRRDMIIVAALINAGLLVVLFVSAVKTDGPKEVNSVVSAQEKVVKAEVAKPASVARKGDQIDQVLSQYNAKIAKTEKKEPAKVEVPSLTPKAKPKTVAAKSTDVRTVTVAKGDVLERIAKNHGVSVDDIMKFNSLPNSRLQIGQVLKLPKKLSKVPVAQKVKNTEGEFYVVKSGDNPWTIAHQNGMQVEELLKLNNMDKTKAKRLRPGDKLRIK